MAYPTKDASTGTERSVPLGICLLNLFVGSVMPMATTIGSTVIRSMKRY
jgi:hypothetical protein